LDKAVARRWPALHIRGADDLLPAVLDDFSPTAVEEHGSAVRVFFATSEQRDAALAALVARERSAEALEVSDEDWAVRSQQNLTPIAIGRVRVLPDPAFLNPASPWFQIDRPGDIQIVIVPSMGFGTGHHATTRLCLAALQALDLGNRRALDVGTGSGILAIAAARLGAADVHGIDCDADAIRSANDNLALNPDARHVTFAVTDLASGALPRADLVMANLTGAALVRSAGPLLAAANAGGTLVLSGLLDREEAEVRQAFSSAALAARAESPTSFPDGSLSFAGRGDTEHGDDVLEEQGGGGLVCQRRGEDEWVCLTMKKV
jgi:ribosomal protein L11 methyltransferase